MAHIPPLWVLILVTAPLTWGILAWAMTRPSHPWRRNALGGITLILAFGTPWLIPADLSWLRFTVLVPCFAAVGKTLEVLTGSIPSPSRLNSPARFLVWVLVLPDGDWPEAPEARQAAKAGSGRVARRTALKLVGGVGLLALNSTVPLHHNIWLSCLWMAFLLYFTLSGALDLLYLPFRLAGVEVAEAFDAPPLARNPRDFWSRRWNLWFTNLTNRLIFQPLGGAQRPIRAAAAVFIFSALLHEYMVWVALGAPDGRMTAFFLLHGAATIATTVLGQRLDRRTLMPRGLAVALHIAWFALTGPLFFGPVEDIFTLTAWRW